MPLAMLAIVSGLFWVLLTLSRPSTASGAAAEAERLLDIRYARGEIDDNEYRHRLAVLRGADTAMP
jgi:putative membrane protein